MGEELITSFPRGIDAFCAKRTANPFLGERGGIHRIMEKPRSVVIPQMMVWISFADAKGGEGEEVGWHDA